MTQTFNGYLNDNAYKAISELLQYIIKNYPGEYIIVGDFNVQGHEKIFRHFLSDQNYHICNFYPYITCNDEQGIGSPDGIVISKKLYNHIKYGIDIYPGYSYQHYMLTAKLYINGPIKTECVINKKMLLLFKQLNNLHTSENYMNNSGNFNINIHKGDINNIKEVPLNKSDINIYINKILTDKINNIKT